MKIFVNATFLFIFTALLSPAAYSGSAQQPEQTASPSETTETTCVPGHEVSNSERPDESASGDAQTCLLDERYVETPLEVVKDAPPPKIPDWLTGH